MSSVVSTQTVAGIVPMIDLNPLHWLGDKAKETLADGFTSMMMSIWSGALWLLKTAFGLIDNFTPNVADPDLAKLYSVTLWIALVIALLMAFGQIGHQANAHIFGEGILRVQLLLLAKHLHPGEELAG